MTGRDLAQRLELLDIKQGEFAQLTDRDPSTISKWLKQESEFSKDVLKRIQKGLDAGKKADRIHVNSSTEEDPVMGGRQYDIPFNQPDPDMGFVELMRPIFNKLKKNEKYKLFPVEGASMMTSIFPGDWLLCRKDEVLQIVNGRVYVLLTNNKEMNTYRPSGRWVKRCYLRDSHVTCKSDNMDSSEPYITFQLDINEITECWYPVFLITGQLLDPNKDIYERLEQLEERIELLETLNQ